MKRVFALTALLAAAVVGFGNVHEAAGPRTVARAATAQAPPLGIVFTRGAQTLARVDPLSLRATPGRRVPLQRHMVAWSFSPDRSQLVLARDDAAELRFVDVRRMRLRGDVRAGSGSVLATAWPAPGRVLAVISGETTASVVVVDAGTRRVLARVALSRPVLDFERARDGLVLLLGSLGAIGPAGLAVVGPDGSVRTTSLEQIPAGFVPPADDSETYIETVRIPGLAADPEAGHAYVIGAGAPVADVDLATLGVAYHALSQPVSLLGRLSSWLVPAAEAKGADGPVRSALWLGGGLIAVSGTDSHAFPDPDGNEQFQERAAGLELIDTRDWSVRTLDSGASGFAFAAGTLLAFGSSWDSAPRTQSGVGVSGYGLDGSRLYHLFGDRPAWAQAAGDYFYVAWDQAMNVVDVRTGAVLRTLTRPNGNFPQLITGDWGGG